MIWPTLFLRCAIKESSMQQRGRKSMQFPGATNIIDGLVWLGSKFDASNEAFLRQHNIKCVINMAEELENPGIPVETYVKIAAKDEQDYPIIELHSAQTTQILAEQIAQMKPTLIHCAAGINRSATMLGDFVAKITQMPAQQVIIWIRSLRPIALTNPGFVDQLIRHHSR